MTIVIKRLLVYLPTLVDQPKTAAAGVLGELKEIAEAYMEAYRDDDDTRARVRKNLCQTIFEFYEWYQRNDADSMCPYTLLMKKKK